MEFKEWTWALIVCCLATVGVFGWLLLENYRKRRLLSVSSPLLLAYLAPFGALVSAFLAIIIAYIASFGISWGIDPLAGSIEGREISFVLDVSKSMNTQDISVGFSKISRLESAKQAIAHFLLKHPDDSVGLTIFSGEASRMIPFTNDHALFLSLLDGVDYRNLTVQGTNFENALTLGSSFFSTGSIQKAVLLMSDGGDEVINTKSFSSLTQKFPDIKYLIIGIGSEAGGYIPDGVNLFGETTYVYYNNAPVLSKRNDSLLSDLASSLHTHYSKNDTLASLDTSLASLKKKLMTPSSSNKTKDHSGQIFLLALFFLLLSAFPRPLQKFISLFPYLGKKKM